MGRALARLVTHIRGRAYGNRVIGLHVCTGYTGEWQSWGLWDNRRGDFSPAAVREWRGWLKGRYRDNQGLQAAWNRKNVSLETAAIPERSRREGQGPRLLRHAAEYQDVIDFYRFYPELVADSIIELASRAKTAGDGQPLIGVFYGYALQCGARAQESQHLALDRILACPHIDFLCSPGMYSFRAPGEASTFMSATGSVNLHGKLWFHEADNRTHLVAKGTGFEQVCPAKDLAETRAVLWREFGHCMQRAAPLWWFDMGGGWYDDPAILADFARMSQLTAPLLIEEPDRLPPPRIFVIHGYRSYPRQQPEHGFLTVSTVNQVSTLAQVGSPSEVYLLSGLDRVVRTVPPGPKVFLFINCADLTDTDRTRIVALKRDGNILVFVHAAGLGRVDNQADVTESITAMSDLLGMVSRSRSSLFARMPDSRRRMCSRVSPTCRSGLVSRGRLPLRSVAWTRPCRPSRGTLMGAPPRW